MAWTISNAMMKDYENSRSLLVPAAASLEVTCSDGEPSAPLSTTPMPDQYYWPDKTTEHSRLFRFGMMCEPLTAQHGADVLTWYLEGFHVRTYLAQEKARESTENDLDFGQKWRGLLAKYDHNTHLLKIPQCLLFEDLNKSLQIWPAWGLMQNGECLEVMKSGDIAYGNDYGLLPAPQKADGMSFYATTKESAEKRINRGISQEMIIHAVGLIAYKHLNKWHANPRFYQALMDWPIGWTSLVPLETDKMQDWQQQHGGF